MIDLWRWSRSDQVAFILEHRRSLWCQWRHDNRTWCWYNRWSCWWRSNTWRIIVCTISSQFNQVINEHFRITSGDIDAETWFKFSTTALNRSTQVVVVGLVLMSSIVFPTSGSDMVAWMVVMDRWWSCRIKFNIMIRHILHLDVYRLENLILTVSQFACNWLRRHWLLDSIQSSRLTHTQLEKKMQKMMNLKLYKHIQKVTHQLWWWKFPIKITD